ncbi:FCD domain-containing protein [Escherichia coli]
MKPLLNWRKRPDSNSSAAWQLRQQNFHSARCETAVLSVRPLSARWRVGRRASFQSQCYQLEQNLHQQRIAIDASNWMIFLNLDDNFHQLLTQVPDCQLAWDTIENLKATVHRVRFMSFEQCFSTRNAVTPAS